MTQTRIYFFPKLRLSLLQTNISLSCRCYKAFWTVTIDCRNKLKCLRLLNLFIWASKQLPFHPIAYRMLSKITNDPYKSTFFPKVKDSSLLHTNINLSCQCYKAHQSVTIDCRDKLPCLGLLISEPKQLLFHLVAYQTLSKLAYDPDKTKFSKS